MDWRLVRLVPNGLVIYLPHWFLIALSMAAAASPWFRFRFSLRTLLIGTTLVAAFLGLIVYAVRG